MSNLEINIFENCVCDLCGSSESRSLFTMPDLRNRIYNPEYNIIECKNCKHRYLNPRPSKSNVHLFYKGKYYSGRSSIDISQSKRYEIQAQLLPQISKGKILDIGCAGGGWLKTILKNGWDCYGQDIIDSPYREDNIDIKIGYLPEVDYESSFFDVVSAWGVLEHVHEPSLYFKKIYKILKNDGRMIMMVPNGDSLWSRFAYKEDIPRHLHFFRPKVLKKYAVKYNFEFEKIIFSNQIYSRPSTGRGLIRTRVLKELGASWEEIINKPNSIFLKFVGSLMSVFDNIFIHPYLEEKFGLCGNMVVFLKKRG